jgi:hypothetical protein
MNIRQLLQKAIAGEVGAASELAAALKIDIVWYPNDVWAHSGSNDASVDFSAYNGDRHAAMTQAIIRVATAVVAE